MTDIIKPGRHRQIYLIIKKYGPITDSEIMQLTKLGSNQVTSRIAELIQNDFVEIHDKVLRSETGKRVRRTVIKSKYSPKIKEIKNEDW